MEENITISFTKNEASVLVQLLDLATKSGGLQVAEAAVVLTKKIQEKFDTEPATLQPVD
jgi:hypothetical protein